MLPSLQVGPDSVSARTRQNSSSPKPVEKRGSDGSGQERDARSLLAAIMENRPNEDDDVPKGKKHSKR
jgi:hypothetical protein